MNTEIFIDRFITLLAQHKGEDLTGPALLRLILACAEHARRIAETHNFGDEDED